MTGIPDGWTATTLGSLGRHLNGRGFKKAEWSDTGRPIIRIQNLTGSGGSFNYFQGDVEDRYVARPGDLLVSWAATLGAFIWNGPEGVVNQHIFKVESSIDRKFHRYLLDYKLNDLMKRTHGSGMVHITRSRFDATPVMLPSAEEQRRIVDILEDHLSRLDAADAGLGRVGKRLAAYEASALSRCRGGREVPLGDVTLIQGGIQKQQSRAPRANAYPFLRVANVTKRGLDLYDVHQVELFDGELERVRLRRGDLLVVEGNGSSAQIGRAALWDGSIENCVHQNHLIRVRPKADLEAGYLEAVWNSPQSRQRLTALSSSSSGLHTLSVGKLKSLYIPVPSRERQRILIDSIRDVRDRRQRLDAEVHASQTKATRMRRSLLAAAFTGRLTGRYSDTDIVEELADA